MALAIELDNSGFDQGPFVGSRDGTFDERFRNSTSEFDSPSQRMSLNELGQIAFEDGGIVLCEGLNNFGPIVMTVQSQNAVTFEVRTFIVKATPRR